MNLAGPEAFLLGLVIGLVCGFGVGLIWGITMPKRG